MVLRSWPLTGNGNWNRKRCRAGVQLDLWMAGAADTTGGDSLFAVRGGAGVERVG